MVFMVQAGDAVLRLQRILASIHTVACAHPAASPLAAAAPQPPAGNGEDGAAGNGGVRRGRRRDGQLPVVFSGNHVIRPARLRHHSTEQERIRRRVRRQPPFARRSYACARESASHSAKLPREHLHILS